MGSTLSWSFYVPNAELGGDDGSGSTRQLICWFVYQHACMAIKATSFSPPLCRWSWLALQHPH